MRGEFVDVDGRRLYYYAAGSRGAGEPIVLVHGVATSGHCWGQLVPLLPPGFRVVVLDLLGHGRSDPAGQADMTNRGHASRLTSFVRALGINRCAMMGHAFGSQIVLHAARLEPGLVTRLALINPECGPRSAPTCGLWRVAGAMLPPDPLRALTRRHLESMYVDRTQGRHSADQYLRPFREPDGVSSLRRQLRSLQPFVLAHATAGVSSPLLVMYGADGAADSSNGGTANAAVVRIGECRGALPEEAPQRVATAVHQLLADA